MQIMASAGYASESDMQRMWRDAGLYRFGEGTNELQRDIIAKRWGCDERNPVDRRRGQHLDRGGAAGRPAWGRDFFVGKMKVDQQSRDTGISLEQMMRRMDEAGIERAFLIAAKSGRPGLPGSC